MQLTFRIDSKYNGKEVVILHYTDTENYEKYTTAVPHVLANLMPCVSMTPSSLLHRMLLFLAGRFPAMRSASAFISILTWNTRSIWMRS